MNHDGMNVYADLEGASPKFVCTEDQRGSLHFNTSLTVSVRSGSASLWRSSSFPGPSRDQLALLPSISSAPPAVQ